MEEDKVQLLPIVTKQKFMQDKKINYKNYAILVLFSNFQDINENTEEGFEGVYDTERYVYENKIIKNKAEVESMSKTKIETFIKTSRKIAKMTNGEMVGVRRLKKSGKIVYDLFKGNLYVKIEEDILRVMCNGFSSNTIKIYCYLKWRLRDKKDGEYITRKQIAENIGLSPNSHKNLQLVKDCTKILDNNFLIKKETISLPSIDGKDYNYRTLYELVDYETWREKWYSK